MEKSVMEDGYEMEMSEACGLVGVVSVGEEWERVEVAKAAVLGLEQVQHRGTESAGLAVVPPPHHPHQGHFLVRKDHGLVREVFAKESDMEEFGGSRAVIAHNRYSTAGRKGADNAIQPFVVFTAKGPIAVAHNGELVEKDVLRSQVLNSGVGLSTDTDSELIAQLLALELVPGSVKQNGSSSIPLKAHNGHSNGLSTNDHHPGGISNLVTSQRSVRELGDMMLNLMKSRRLKLSYSLLLMCGDGIVAVRDPWGNRPLCIGAIRDQEGSVCALVGTSESCALAAMGAELWREVEPGELVLLSPLSTPPSSPIHLTTLSARPESPTALCIFEFVYFARPASRIQGIEVNSVRLRCGELLAVKAGVRGADIVSNVPDSASPAAIGFAQKAGLPYRPVLSKNPYVGRTFIQPNTASRISGIKRKFSVLTEEVVGKRIVLVDDSIVRGNTMGALVKVLKASGAKEVHLRVASPPIRWPCFYGINIPARQELLVSSCLLSCPSQLGKGGSCRLLERSLRGWRETGPRSRTSSSLPSPPSWERTRWDISR